MAADNYEIHAARGCYKMTTKSCVTTESMQNKQHYAMADKCHSSK